MLSQINSHPWASIFCGQLDAWIWTRCMEKFIHAFTLHFRCIWQSSVGWAWSLVIIYLTNDSIILTQAMDDTYQCSIAAFDGLLSEPHNSSILELLFICCNWHGLAKLCMHTDHTLDIFDTVTITIGSALHHFVTITCNAFSTKELHRETAACQHCASQNASWSSNAIPTTSEQSFNALPKMFNILTIKNHLLGDYPNQICHFGTTDSYSTEPVWF